MKLLAVLYGLAPSSEVESSHGGPQGAGSGVDSLDQWSGNWRLEAKWSHLLLILKYTLQAKGLLCFKMVLRFKKRIHDRSYELKTSVLIRLRGAAALICLCTTFGDFSPRRRGWVVSADANIRRQKLNTSQAKFASPPLKAMLLSQGQFFPPGT